MQNRRQLIRSAAAGATVVAAGALLRVATDDLTKAARAESRADGRPRLPPGQHVLEYLRPMGGDEGDGEIKSFRLRVHGLVKTPLELDYAALLKLPQVT